MMRNRSVRGILCLFVMFASATQAFGWGRDGHQVVAMIAAMRLTPQAKAGVATLLGKKDLADVANWADEIRQKRDATGPWHYVDIPYEFKTYDAARDGKDGNNVIAKLNEFANLIGDRNQTQDARFEALKFTIHFMGDLHQPMHCAERNEDKGGNFRLVWFPGDKKATNLHKIWDTAIVDASMGQLKLDEYAKKLNDSITKDDEKNWSGGNPEQWANESHLLAVNVCYKDIPADGDPPKITDEYLQTAEKTVDIQLSRAGLRLANLLNYIYR